MSISRRNFLTWTGRTISATALATLSWRLWGKDGGGPRKMWQIDPSKCTYCGICETACVRTPSAVKAVNDLRKCDYCVICYGHIKNTDVDPKKIETEGKKVCPHDAVTRTHLFREDTTIIIENNNEDAVIFSDDDEIDLNELPAEFQDLDAGDKEKPGDEKKRLSCNETRARDYYLYDIDHGKCTACGKCTRRCFNKGMGSMTLIIRPDLCLGCNMCRIATKCPENAIVRIKAEEIEDYPTDQGPRRRTP